MRAATPSFLPSQMHSEASIAPTAVIDAAEQAARFGRYTVDIPTWTVTWSAGVAAIFGRTMPPGGTMSLDEHIGCYHEDDARACRFALAAAMAGPYTGGPYTSQGRVLRPDGAIRHVMAQGTGFADKRGFLATTNGILLDVTEAVEADRIAREHAETLRVTLEAMDQGIMMVGPDQCVRVVNKMAKRLLDLPDTLAVPGKPFAELLAHQEQAGEFTRLAAEDRACLLISSHDASARTYTRQRPNGAVLEVRTSPLADGGFVRTYSDVTARHRQERALVESEEKYRLLAENVTDTIIWFDLDMRRRYVSPSVRTLLGYEPAELLGLTPMQNVHEDDVAAYTADIAALIGGETDQMRRRQRYRRKDGSIVWVDLTSSAIREPGSGAILGYVTALRDASAQVAAENAIAHMATHDPLTGLANRTLFLKQLDQQIGSAADHGIGFAVLACDLDRFKAVNDTFGHAAGDELLVTVARRLSSAIRAEDIVARFGGDEFFILLGNVEDQAYAVETAERAIAAMSEPVEIAGQSLAVGISIGITIGLDHGRTPSTLCDRADLAMYVAKASGRNLQRVYDGKMDVLRPSATHEGSAIAVRRSVGGERIA